MIKYTAPITVFGAAPRLWLDLGGTDGYAEYNSMSDGTNDTLVFVYVVQEGGYCWMALGRTEENVGPARGVIAYLKRRIGQNDWCTAHVFAGKKLPAGKRADGTRLTCYVSLVIVVGCETETVYSSSRALLIFFPFELLCCSCCFFFWEVWRRELCSRASFCYIRVYFFSRFECECD